jgi:hypothetical protein
MCLLFVQCNNIGLCMYFFVSCQIGVLGHNNVDSADRCDENLSIVCEILLMRLTKEIKQTPFVARQDTRMLNKSLKIGWGLCTLEGNSRTSGKTKTRLLIWKQLVNNETGIGWDESGKNIVMTMLGGKGQHE